MASHLLKLNDDKTELVVFGSPQMINNLVLPTFHIGDEQIFCSDSACNIGAIFDTSMRTYGQNQYLRLVKPLVVSLEILAK